MTWVTAISAFGTSAASYSLGMPGIVWAYVVDASVVGSTGLVYASTSVVGLMGLVYASTSGTVLVYVAIVDADGAVPSMLVALSWLSTR